MKNKHKWSAVFALAAMVAMAFGFASCSNTSDNNNLLLLAAMSGGSTPTGAYAVTVASGIEHGSVTADRSRADKDVTVTLTITPSAANYVLGSIIVTKTDGSAVILRGDGNTRTFTMPESNVTVNAMFIDTAFKYASDFVSTQFYYVKDVQWSTSNPVGTVSSPRMPYYVDEHGEAQSLTDADFTPGSYIKLTKNDGTVDCGNYFGTAAGSKQIPTYTMVLYTAKTDGSGFTQKTIGTNVQILGIEEKGFMAENQTTIRNYGMFFYTQKGWAATSNGTVSLNVNYTGHVYPTLDEIVTYIGTIN